MTKTRGVLNNFLAQKLQPLIDKVNTNPEHPEQVLTLHEGIELITDCVLKDMVEKGELSISEKDGEFSFEWKGDQNYVNQRCGSR